ncbi:MAG: ChbG/HpnK family deacetylase, partial [Anaerolineales bacterium]
MEYSSIRVVTRGDDAGLCHTANIAIRDAVEHGILRNVSVMAPAPAFDEAAEIFSALQGVTCGLHVDLTAEWEHLRWGPVLSADRVPSLVDAQGFFFQSGENLMNRGAKLEHMQAEVRAQLNKAREAGLHIQYLDEHMGVGWINDLGEWLGEFCEQQGLICNRTLFQHGKLQGLPRSENGDTPVDKFLLSLHKAESGTYLLVGHPATMTEEMLAAYLPGQLPGIEARNRDWQRRMF